MKTCHQCKTEKKVTKTQFPYVLSDDFALARFKRSSMWKFSRANRYTNDTQARVFNASFRLQVTITKLCADTPVLVLSFQ